MQAERPGDLTHYLAGRTPVERELTRLFARAEPLVIFDIGACEGEESIRYSRRFPRARLFTFEPLPANQNLIRQNFERYGITAAELVSAALSDRAGTATFHVSSGRPPDAPEGEDWNHGNKSSSLLPPADAAPMFGWLTFKQAITVQTMTLDEFVAARALPRIDFIHLDVQGAEHLVLAGAARSLPRVKAIWLEVSDQELYRGQRLRADTERAMNEAGFTKALEIRHGVEGDQFYVNKRFPRLWPYLSARKLVNLLRGRPAVQA